jgi:hypothetical protein
LNYGKVWQNPEELPVGLIVGCVEIFKIISTTPGPSLSGGEFVYELNLRATQIH